VILGIAGLWWMSWRPRVQYELWQWGYFAAAAMIVGMSKCGIPGIGILNVVLFQHALLAKDATGFGLPVLVIGDLCAAIAYRKHAEWALIIKLAPWTLIGIVGGFLALKYMDHDLAGLIIASLLALMLVIHAIREWRKGSLESAVDHAGWVAPVIGIAAGFTTTIGNAAGPLLILYMLSMRFPKLKFMGVSVYFFLLVNIVKIPFLAHLDLVSIGSLKANGMLIPFVLVGGAIGIVFAKRVHQVWFDRTAFWLSALAVAHLLWNAVTRYGS